MSQSTIPTAMSGGLGGIDDVYPNPNTTNRFTGNDADDDTEEEIEEDTDMAEFDEDELDDPTAPTLEKLEFDPAPQRNPQEVVAATPFAGVYRSIYTLQEPGNRILPLLQHVNCSYLSTPGLAPSILQLKQHAQALVVLIKSLTISTLPAVIDNANSGIDGIPAFNDGETYDFLNDLTVRYENPKNKILRAHHNMPLTALLNVLEEENIPGRHHEPDRVKIWDVCPLHHSEKTPANQPSLPYATHQTLISHANEVLELLDHEYSAKGGLLSILPSKEEKEDREAAESTLLGQLILYIQRLVQRVHDLERCYANAMDVIAGESVVPHQTLSKFGPDGRQGRQPVYPQDRFILVNAGNDLYQYLNEELEKKEVVDEAVMKNYQKLGVTGEALWEKRGGKDMSKGIVALDVTTRYYRLKGDPLKTIFIIPAHQQHPGTRVTREMEAKPTVVTVVKPVWPERHSTLEMKHRADLEDYKRIRIENAQLTDTTESLKESQTVLQHTWELTRGELRELKREYDELHGIMANNENITKRGLFDKISEVNKLHQELNAAKAGILKDREKAKEERATVTTLRQSIDKQQQAVLERLRKQEEEFQSECEKERLRQKAQDQENGRTATETANKLRNAWTHQIRDTAVINAFLQQKLVNFASENPYETLPPEVNEVVNRWTQSLLDHGAPWVGPTNTTTTQYP